jgi:hypothetical protein
MVQTFFLFLSQLLFLSITVPAIHSEDKLPAVINPGVKTEYTAAERSQLLKKGCQLFVHIKGVKAEGKFIIIIKEDFNPKVKKVKKGIFVKALEQCCFRVEKMKEESRGGDQTQIVASDEREAASYKKRVPEVDKIHNDQIRYMKYQDDHEEILLFCLSPRRMAKIPPAMTTTRKFMDVFNFSYGDFFHSIEQLVYFDEIQFDGEIISVQKREFNDVHPGLFYWMTSD